MKLKNKSVRFWQAPFYAWAVFAMLTAPESASAQCCGGSAVGGYGGEIAGDFMGMPMMPGLVMEENAIYLTVNVPEKAILQINGDPTISLGPTRYFVVRGLEPGRTYSFEIIAETANPAGVAMEEKKTVKVQSGSNEIVTLKPVKRKVPRPVGVAGDIQAAEDKAATNAYFKERNNI